MSGYLKAETNRSLNNLTKAGQKVCEQTEKHHARSRQNLWGLMVFLLISIAAFSFKDFNLFEAASEPVRQILGYPPPAYLISVALAVYCGSAIILVLTSIANDLPPASSWKHLGYRSAFYLFYCFSGTIAGHFFPVLMIGLLLYGMDRCHIWVYNAKAIKEQKELLGKF